MFKLKKGYSLNTSLNKETLLFFNTQAIMRGVKRGNNLAKKSIRWASNPNTMRFFFFAIFFNNLLTIFWGSEQTKEIKELSFSFKSL